MGRETIPAGEAGHLGDVADHDARAYRADAEDVGEAGAGGLHHGGELLAGLAQLGIDVAQVRQELGGEFSAGRPPSRPSAR